MSTLDSELVARTAQLARLALSPEQEKRLAADLGKIFELFDVLDDDAIRSKAPLAHPLGDIQPLRDDVAIARDMHPSIAENAPHAEDGFFTVPKVIE
ncbi:MAG: Asp-tRNA(Asn)/Glu-tRNA(Gln) amidotransferase subunit GatC [Cardiobacteriaceae bacterium]|nr:Asp-tRNA(Asn)/Glu-tRNA(Gln) amidotransferase subunit GatC [Cardiobacteriaceae bacterium]